jgi:hypothetical protein
MFNTISEQKKREKQRAEKYSSFINIVALRDEPKPDSHKTIQLRGQRMVPSSPLVLNGVVDGNAMNTEAKNWLNQVQGHEKSDEAFWSKKAPTKSKKLWNDDSIPDDLFAADDEIVDPRQELKQKLNRLQQ